MASDLTVIYYTGHTKPEGFSEKIRQNLLEAIGDLPLISVSQRPLDFGHNICVGEIGPSGKHSYRQRQIGAAAASTPFVAMAEDDTLYPKEYFAFLPTDPQVLYVCESVWELRATRRHQKCFSHKARTDGAMITGRECFVAGINLVLDGAEPGLFAISPRQGFTTEIPVVAFKTDYCLNARSPVSRTQRVRTLPYWGEAHDLLRAYELIP